MSSSCIFPLISYQIVYFFSLFIILWVFILCNPNYALSSESYIVPTCIFMVIPLAECYFHIKYCVTTY